jgi:competence protein ComEC
MNIWNNLPFVRLLIAFLSGILMAINFPMFVKLNWMLFLIPITLLLILNQWFKPNYQYRFIKGFPIFIFLFLFGIKLVELNNEINYNNHFSKHKHDYYLVKIDEPAKNKQNTLKIIGEIIATKDSKSWKKTTGKILVYIAKDAKAAKLKYGDIILCNSNIKTTPAPKNPFEFNYKKYLGFHQIYHQTYLNSKNWIHTKQKKANPILVFSYQLRNYLLSLISQHHIHGDEYAIGSALILGYEDDLSNEVIGSFAATGALHVLSVSGLHVGIVFLVLNYFLQFLGESKPARITRFIVSVSGLWLYALITGLSPSVWRAAAMFSLITAGKFYKKDISTFNIIGCSAFILLCINPYMITEVGFQLSYLAVFGIVTFHQKFYDLLIFKNKILDNIWSISCVSVAAQLVTFPLGLLYFHQFPNYFLFSNLVVIPLSTIILYAGILLLAVAKIPVAGALLAKVLHSLLWILKYTVSVFENLPLALIEGIAISTFETFLIYGIVISLYAYWLQKKLFYINIALFLCISICSLQIAEKINQVHQKKIVIYAINKHFAVDFITGNNNVLLADSLLLKDKDKMKFHLTPHWNQLGLKNVKTQTNAKNSALLDFKGHYLFFKTKIILNTNSDSINIKHLNYKPEIVLLSKVSLYRFKAIFKLFPAAKFVCDGTISPNLFAHLRRKNKEINLRSVMNEGAIIIEG